MNITEQIKKLKEYILNSNNIVISGHKGPDGDAIGAGTALYEALKQIKENVYLFYDEFPSKYDVIPNSNNIQHELNKNIDLYITVDCGGIDRLDLDAKIAFSKTSKTVNIDHHYNNENFAQVNIVDDNASSTCEIMYKIIRALQLDINKNIAESLYCGIIFDTGGFKFDKTSYITHEITAELHKYMGDFTHLYNVINDNMSFNQYKMQKLAFNKVEFYNDNRLAFVQFTIKDFKDAGTNKNDLDGIVGKFLNIETVEVSILVYEAEKNFNKCSLRSRKKDVNIIARKFNGGGHILASGCAIKESPEKCKELILDNVKELINFD